jgi:Na+/H+-dicarboxylate symporter
MAMTRVEEESRHLMGFRALLLTSITSALAFVVGLFWNDAIKSAIEQLVPKGHDIAAKFISAIMVTMIVVITVYLLFRAQRLAEENLIRLAKLPKKLKKAQA